MSKALSAVLGHPQTRQQQAAWDARCAERRRAFEAELALFDITLYEPFVMIRFRIATADWAPFVAFYSEDP